jgi:hypothetical protein
MVFPPKKLLGAYGVVRKFPGVHTPFHPYLSDYERLNQVSGILHKIVFVDEVRKNVIFINLKNG